MRWKLTNTDKIIDGIQLAAAAVFSAFALLGTLHYYKMTTDVDQLTAELHTAKTIIFQQQSDNASMASSIIVLTDEVQLREDLTSVIVDAARAYNVDPMLLAKLIKSESNFRPDPKHALPQVTGSSGINTKANSKLKHNPYSYVGNIYASAEILSRYIETSDSLTLALTRYKGLSPQGFGQAKEILKEYNKSNQ